MLPLYFKSRTFSLHPPIHAGLSEDSCGRRKQARDTSDAGEEAKAASPTESAAQSGGNAFEHSSTSIRADGSEA